MVTNFYMKSQTPIEHSYVISEGKYGKYDFCSVFIHTPCNVLCRYGLKV